MASYGLNDVKNGVKILVNNDPCVITETEYVKPGKGQAFTRIKYRNIKSGRVVEMTMKATDSLEVADVMDTDMQFLYADGEYWHFMQTESFEQVQAEKTAVGDSWQWLKGEENCVVTLWNGQPIAVQAPNFVELKIVETDPLLPAQAKKPPTRPDAAPWQDLWRDAIRDPRELLSLLGLEDLADSLSARAAEQFPLRVPRGFAARMRHGDRHDPLLRQVLPVLEEERIAPGYSLDAVGDGAARGATGVLHKYQGRALLVATVAAPCTAATVFAGISPTAMKPQPPMTGATPLPT